MAWIRWECGTPDSDVVGWLAHRLGVEPAQALGHYAAVCCKVGEHRPDGHIADVPDAQLAQWALWRGRSSRFVDAFRERCQDETGNLRGWWRQVRLDEKRERDRIRQQRARANKSKPAKVLPGPTPEPVTRDDSVTVRVTSNPCPDANGRTDGRTDSTDGPDWAGRELEPDARVAFDALCRSHPRPRFFAMLVRKYGPGGTTERCDWPTLGRALLRFTGSSMHGTPGDTLLCKLIDAEKAAARPEFGTVTDDLGRDCPAVKAPDGSWRQITEDEARALGWKP